MDDRLSQAVKYLRAEGIHRSKGTLKELRATSKQYTQGDRQNINATAFHVSWSVMRAFRDLDDRMELIQDKLWTEKDAIAYRKAVVAGRKAINEVKKDVDLEDKDQLAKFQEFKEEHTTTVEDFRDKLAEVAEQKRELAALDKDDPQGAKRQHVVKQFDRTNESLNKTVKAITVLSVEDEHFASEAKSLPHPAARPDRGCDRAYRVESLPI